MSDASFDWDGGASYSLPYQATVRVYNRPLGNTVTAQLSMYNETFGDIVETKTVNGQGGTYTFNISREYIEMHWPATMVGNTYTLDLIVKDTTNNITLKEETAILTIAEL